MIKPKRYIFSGLGADHRAFQKLDFSATDYMFIRWIDPLKSESLSDYAKRISQQISEPGAIYIGLSMGGMVATEVAKHIVPERIILISSAAGRSEIPGSYRLAGKLRLHKLIPAKLMLRTNFLTYWFFGTKTSEDKRVLREILRDTNPAFLKWAIHAILTRKNQTPFTNTFRIHGDTDHILPAPKTKIDLVVKGGGHLMILNKAAVIQSVLIEQKILFG